MSHPAEGHVQEATRFEDAGDEPSRTDSAHDAGEGPDDSTALEQDAGAMSCHAAFEPFAERVTDDQLASACCPALLADGELSLACACSVLPCPSLVEALATAPVEQLAPPYSTRCGCGTVSIGLLPGVVWTYDLVTHQLVGVWSVSDLALGPCEAHVYRAGLHDSDCAELAPCAQPDVLGACGVVSTAP